MKSKKRPLKFENNELFEKLSEESITIENLSQVVREYLYSSIQEEIRHKPSIYSKVVDDLGVPRPTVRRVARDLRTELLQKIQILQSDINDSIVIQSSEQKNSPSSKNIHQESEKPKKEQNSMFTGINLNEFEQNKLTFKKLKPSLMKDTKYLGKYVAIVENQVFGEDSNEIDLAKQVYEKKGYVPMYIGLVSKKEKKTKIPSILGVK